MKRNCLVLGLLFLFLTGIDSFNILRSLNFIAVVEEERAKWEASKRQEAQGLVDYYSKEPGRKEVSRLNKEDGR